MLSILFLAVPAVAVTLDPETLHEIPGRSRLYCAPIDGSQYFQLVTIGKNGAPSPGGAVQVKILRKKKLRNRLRNLAARGKQRVVRRVRAKLRLSRKCKKRTPATTAGGEFFLYSFSEGLGDHAKDSSRKRYRADLSGSFDWSSSGLGGGSLLLINARAALQIPAADFPIGNALSFHIWALPLYPDTDPEMHLFSKASGTATNDHDLMLSLFGQEHAVRIRLRTSEGTKTHIADAATFHSGHWTHIAFTYDGQTLRLYQDGIETDTFSQSGAVRFRSELLSAIGNQPVGAGEKGFNGYLDEVALYNRVLTPGEVEILASNSPPSLPPFCGNSSCDDSENASTCPSDCSATCGNSEIESGEQCDDANDIAGDGCNRECQLETECNDGIDNDSDGAIDTSDYSRSKGSRDSESMFLSACQDGIDNDIDGDTDYPNDAECLSLQYNSEEALGCGCPGIVKPGPTNTGPSNTGVLTSYSCPTKITSDTAIEKK